MDNERRFIEVVANTTDDPIIKETCMRFLETGEMPRPKGIDKRYLTATFNVVLDGLNVPIRVEYDRLLNLLMATTTGRDWEYLNNQVAYDHEGDSSEVEVNYVGTVTNLYVNGRIG